LLRAEPSGHPEGVQAPEGSPTIRGGCLANARQDRCSRRDCDNLAGKKKLITSYLSKPALLKKGLRLYNFSPSLY